MKDEKEKMPNQPAQEKAPKVGKVDAEKVNSAREMKDKIIKNQQTVKK